MKALVLFSGGLDSTIALKLLKDHGLDTYAIYVETGFVNTDYDHLKFIAEQQIGAKLIILMRQQQYIDKVLFSPQYGYGRFFNPCLDCHRFMIEEAWQWGIDRVGKGKFFLATGEVLDQRGKSQTKHNINRMNKDLGEIANYLVRPLSISFFPKTEPEKLGVINSDKLLNIRGKQRKNQLELIKKLGIKDYKTPAGGCLLTVAGFAQRLKRFSKYYQYLTSDFYLIRHGRHFWFDDKLFVISRNEKETKQFEKFVDPLLRFVKIELPKGVLGPIGILDAKANDDLIKLACGLLLDYAKANKQKEYTFVVNGKIFKNIIAVNRDLYSHKLLKG